MQDNIHKAKPLSKSLSSNKFSVINPKLVLIIASIIASFLYTSCTLDCESVKVGNEKFTSETSLFIPYIDGEQVTFIDDNNKETEFTVKRTETQSMLCTRILCKGLNDPFGTPPCEFVEVPSLSIELQTEDQSKILTLSLYIDIFKSESELFYDALATSYSDESHTVEGRYGLAPHFSNPVFDQKSLPFAAPMTFQAEHKIGNINYQDVYVAATGNDKIYIQPQKGIIAYEIDGNLYRLK